MTHVLYGSIISRVPICVIIVCSLFPKAILFYFYFTLAGAVPYGGRKRSPRISS